MTRNKSEPVSKCFQNKPLNVKENRDQRIIQIRDVFQSKLNHRKELGFGIEINNWLRSQSESVLSGIL